MTAADDLAAAELVVARRTSARPIVLGRTGTWLIAVTLIEVSSLS